MYEPKWDGYRAVLVRDGESTRLWSRQGKDLTGRFVDVASAAADRLPDGCVVDGELVVFTEGRLSFDALQRRLVTGVAQARRVAAQWPASFAAFDLLAAGEVDLRSQPWEKRRRRLESLTSWSGALQLSPVTRDVDEAGEWFEVLAEAMGVEGLVVKGARSRYPPGRLLGWWLFGSLRCRALCLVSVACDVAALSATGVMDGRRRYGGTCLGIGRSGRVRARSVGRTVPASVRCRGGSRQKPNWDGHPYAHIRPEMGRRASIPSAPRWGTMASAGRGKVPGCRHGCARVEIRVVATGHPSGDWPFEPMNPGTHPEELPIEVLDDVASAVGAEVTLLSRLPGGFDVGALRVQLAGRANAVLKAWPRARPNQLDEALRTQRVVEHMRRRGYPTPACLGVGATATHVWHLMDFVDATPAPELTPSLVEQLMEITELQAGQASEPYDHWSYAWRLATGKESGQDLAPSLSRAVAELSGYSSVVSALVERLRLMCTDVPPPREAPDMVHADLKPDNVLIRDGAVVAVVDIGNAGSGTRATDLTTLQWHTFQDPQLDGVRRRLRTRILDLVGWEGAAVLAATQILVQLEWPIRHGHHDVVPGVVKRGHRALDELNALR